MGLAEVTGRCPSWLNSCALSRSIGQTCSPANLSSQTMFVLSQSILIEAVPPLARATLNISSKVANHDCAAKGEPNEQNGKNHRSFGPHTFCSLRLADTVAMVGNRQLFGSYRQME